LPAASHFAILVFASLSNILTPPPETPLAVSSVSELCLDMYINVFERDALLVEKLNDDHLVVLHLLNKKCKQTDIATRILNVVLI
jgi:hypothetical protein